MLYLPAIFPTSLDRQLVFSLKTRYGNSCFVFKSVAFQHQRVRLDNNTIQFPFQFAFLHSWCAPRNYRSIRKSRWSGHVPQRRNAKSLPRANARKCLSLMRTNGFLGSRNRDETCGCDTFLQNKLLTEYRSSRSESSTNRLKIKLIDTLLLVSDVWFEIFSWYTLRIDFLHQELDFRHFSR